jgi:hypothetical protein
MYKKNKIYKMEIVNSTLCLIDYNIAVVDTNITKLNSDLEELNNFFDKYITEVILDKNNLPVKIVFVHDFSYQDNERFDYLGNKCGK